MLYYLLALCSQILQNRISFSKFAFTLLQSANNIHADRKNHHFFKSPDMNIYSYLFYKIYRFLKNTENFDIALGAMLGMTSLMIIDFIALYSISLPGSIRVRYRIHLIIFLVVIIIANFFLYLVLF